MKQKSKEYIKWFKHGIAWSLFYLRVLLMRKNKFINAQAKTAFELLLKETLEGSKKAIQSLKEGR